mgnify:CR=1 FL=1
MSRIIKMSDKIKLSDKKGIGGLRGELSFGIGRHQIKYTNPFGVESYRSEFEREIYKSSNIITIGAYQFIFDKLFNIALDAESPLRIGDLNDEAPQMKIGVPKAEYKSPYYDTETSISDSSLVINSGINISAMNYIFGFMVGSGGAREDNITAITPSYKKRNLYNPIPFRMTRDTSEIPTGQYYGKLVSYNESNSVYPVTSYYVKKFDNPSPHIVHAWVTDNTEELVPVDDTVFTNTTSDAIESYVEINMSLSSEDCREYFDSINTTPRVNEFGLVTGWYNSEKDEYESLRLFSLYTRPSLTLITGDKIEMIYRLYSR